MLLTVGDTVPETSDPSRQYQMVGIPDGLGAHASPFFGDDTWLFDVQAHPPTVSNPPYPDTVEDGQLLLLTGDDG